MAAPAARISQPPSSSPKALTRKETPYAAAPIPTPIINAAAPRASICFQARFMRGIEAAIGPFAAVSAPALAISAAAQAQVPRVIFPINMISGPNIFHAANAAAAIPIHLAHFVTLSMFLSIFSAISRSQSMRGMRIGIIFCKERVNCSMRSFISLAFFA